MALAHPVAGRQNEKQSLVVVVSCGSGSRASLCIAPPPPRTHNFRGDFQVPLSLTHTATAKGGFHGNFRGNFQGNLRKSLCMILGTRATCISVSEA